ncbi:hypothetical protein GPECTOR_16g575 [Gonium pectorale]|uniref:Alpha-1,3-glucosyltransferase n=1 Tax=Gonium pectorale TaxID=33097 RepID=A0A150GKR6_GONPE|nr:hypothetical protein GPECTOR_16g575 [Gonium pectorale]|eukprot:KXZ50402.1 hypothetical protein GPECTOR_16g575 [Gonium pectorale]
MLDPSNRNYASRATVLFQRGSVIVLDVLLLTAAYAIARDVAREQAEDSPRGSGAPSFESDEAGEWVPPGGPSAGTAGQASSNDNRLALLAGGVAAVFAASLGPFIAMGQLRQVLLRLFPFERGLLHTIWAANAWAPYALADKMLSQALPYAVAALRPAGHDREQALMALRRRAAKAAFPDGFNCQTRFAFLPQVSGAAAALAVLAAQAPCLLALWVGDGRPQYIRRTFARSLSYSLLCGFVFGFHVHEKWILMALLPLAVDAVSDRPAGRRFLLLSTAGHYAFMPLIWPQEMYGVKTLLLLSYFLKAPEFLGLLDTCYLTGFVVFELYGSFVHPYAFPVMAARSPLLMQTATSVYCAAGVLAVWAEMAVESAREAAAALAAAQLRRRACGPAGSWRVDGVAQQVHLGVPELRIEG